ncbi:MAG TPA: adenylosuccinate lyase [Leptospiraceae bacterium]|nr:adenylosuccinate lyase [Leptospirales bacterium]HMU85294.1 adenylosuccinate lyase [Leptospiraceae bacterium]HMW60640.1 adenylosuccinate lyase [Leptospiraceae bacterium]HMX56427.1 adenylosuccinate lyase [Leptospiraceae bacterium]HNJ33510.1 adenylosuccinate lyase [Leptospiraceae bacterium]
MIDRYSNPEISRIWELDNKYRIWLDVELAVTRALHKRGQVPDQDWKEIQQKAGFDTAKILEIEEVVQHDVIAFLTNVKDHIGEAGRHLHYGMTSSDLGDTALSLQMVQAADILLKRVDELVDTARTLAIRHKNQVMIGRTHGIHGEPTTLGLKFALFYEEMKRNRARLLRAREEVAVGKMSGAVGTFSANDPEIEEEVLADLGLKPDPISTQVISRDRHAYFQSVLAVIAGSLDRMAQEVRLLQKTETREVEEPFRAGQKGSSAMPHKRNPVVCERICGLARVIQSNAMAGYRNMPLWHERDISHSSAERVILPDSTIALEYILGKMKFVLDGLHIYPDAMQRDLELTRGLIYSQRLLLALVDSGMQREEAYTLVQSASMKVWATPGLTLRNAVTEAGARLSDEKMAEVFAPEYFLRNVDFIYRRLGLS